MVQYSHTGRLAAEKRLQWKERTSPTTIRKVIIPRLFADLFVGVEKADEDIEFTIRVGMIEIYLERIRDLLEPANGDLKVREDAERGIWVEGASEHYIISAQEILDLMSLGARNRKTASTNMNDDSSRSHSIVMVTVSQRNVDTGSTKSGKLYLVDLAGSEKVRKTERQRTRLEEAKNINKSLTNLGRVITALTDGVSAHVPYRDSKLTRILQESLGGNSKCALIICCSPSHSITPKRCLRYDLGCAQSLFETRCA